MKQRLLRWALILGGLVLAAVFMAICVMVTAWAWPAGFGRFWATWGLPALIAPLLILAAGRKVDSEPMIWLLRGAFVTCLLYGILLAAGAAAAAKFLRVL